MVVQPVQHDSHRWHPENLSATLIQGSMGKICQWTNLGTVYVHVNHCRKTCDFSWNASPVRTGRPHLERCVIASRNPKTSHRIHAAHSEKNNNTNTNGLCRGKHIPPLLSANFAKYTLDLCRLQIKHDAARSTRLGQDDTRRQ